LDALRTWLAPLKRRFDVTALLAILGVAIGCANVISLIGVTDTAGYQIFGFLRDVGAQTLFITPYTGQGGEDETAAQRANAGAFLPEDMLAQVAADEQIKQVSGILMLPGHVGYGEQRSFTLVEGTSEDYPDIRGHQIARGRYLTAEDVADRTRVIVLGHAVVEPLFGSAEPLGQQVILKGEQFEVVGVMIEKGFVGTESMDQRVFIPLSTMQELYRMPGVHSIMARVDARDVQRAKRELDGRLRSAQGLKAGDPADFEVSTVEDLTTALNSVMLIFRVMLTAVGGIALLVAGIGIMNVMLMQVIGRTYEIGLRRAVGARRRDIALQFIGEAVTQTLVGSLIGAALGLGLALGFIHLVGWQPHVTATTVLLGIGFSTATGIVFGLYPALYASRLKPIDCLRYE
jgi:putative ABC transport system permease protein